MVELPKAPVPKHLQKAVASDAPLVSEERKEALKRLAEEEILKELAKEEEDRLLDEYKEAARQARIPEEELLPYSINLAPCGGDHIRIDGQIFMHGMTYYWPKAKRDAVAEICQRTWNHEDEIHGKSENEYRRQRDFMVSQNGAVSTTSLMRV